MAATKAAGVDAPDSTQALREFVGLVTQFRTRTARSSGWRPITRPIRPSTPRRSHRELKPAMARLRETGDALESVVAADLWPLPNYRTLLFLK